MRYRIARWTAALVAVQFWLIPLALAAAPNDAARFIEGLGSHAMAIFGQDAPVEQKEAQVRTILAENFDLDLIGQYVVGSDWRNMSKQQQDTYLSLFKEFVLRNYARRLGGYTGDQFQITGTRNAGPDDTVVSTLISRPDGSNLEAGWRVRTSGANPKIVDVIVSGASMVITQRSEFTSVIRREGVDGLITRLRNQLASLSQQQR